MNYQLVLLILFMISNSLQTFAQKEIIYAGTYSERGSEGIYVFELDRANLTLNKIQSISTFESPSFLALDAEGEYLYAVNREGKPGSKNSDFGSVSAFKIDKNSGKLTEINSVSSEGVSPCHISVDKTGKFVFVSHYGSGNLTMFPINSTGGLDQVVDNIQHIGSSVNLNRQERAHLHSSLVTPDNQYLVAADLGIDKLLVYQLDKQNGKLNRFNNSEVNVAPGAGPRHFTYHPGGKFLYLAEEMGSSVTSFDYNKSDGKLMKTGRYSTLPTDYNGSNSVADIHTDPAGKYLFVSNRGHNSLAIFTIDPADGKLKPSGHQSVMGDWPRNFMVDSKGDFLIVANRRTDELVFFELDSLSGKLSPTGTTIKVPSVVCVKHLILK